MKTPTNPGQSKPSNGITRRDALRHVTLLLGGVALTGCAALQDAEIATTPEDRAGQASNTDFSAAQITLLDEIADTILPDTETPGAKAAGVGPFMAVMVNDCYWPGEQARFHAGLVTLQEECQVMHGRSFMNATPDERTALLNHLDREQHDYMRNGGNDEDKHYFRMIKELTLFGYFTSEIGMTQARRYIEIPGAYDPCTPYNGESAWSSI